MKSGLYTNRAMRERLVRGVAILLLLLSGADLACPDCCGGESASASGAEVSVPRGAENAADPMSASDNSGREEPTRPAPCKDDCFCCLRVLQSVGVAAPSAPVSVSQSIVSKSDHLPSPPPRSTYHPPRIA